MSPSADSDSVNWGVQGKFKSDKDEQRKTIINKNSNIIQDDKKILNDIVNKIDNNINSLHELEEFLESYSKVNNEALNSIIVKLKAFKEAIVNEINKI